MIKRLLTGLAAFAVANVSALIVVPVARADNQVEIDQKVRDSLVYISIAYTGYVQIPGSHTDDGQPMWSDSAEADYTCSGFVVDPTGFIATAGHCVNIDTEVKEDLRSQVISDLVDNGKLDKSKADDLTDTANNEEWPVEGKENGSPIARVVQVIQPEEPNRVISQFTTVQVVDSQNTDDGDNALLKVSGMPPLQPLVVSDQVPQPGTALTSVGFPGNIGDSTDQSRLQQPSFKSGTASSQQVSKSGVAGTEINADIGSGMSGGPTVDNSTGEVLGINSYTLTGSSGSDQNFNFITNAPALRTFLQKNGVHLAEPAAPAKSFPWVWVIIGAVAVLAVLVAAIVLLLLLGRRRRPVPAPVPAGQAVGGWPVAAGQQVPAAGPAPTTQPPQAYPTPQATVPPPEYPAPTDSDHPS